VAKDEIQFRCSNDGFHAAKQRLLVTFQCMNMQFPNLNCSIHFLFVSNALQCSAGEFLVRDEHHWVYWTTPGSSRPRVIARLMGCPHWAPQFRSQLLCTRNKSLCLASILQRVSQRLPDRGPINSFFIKQRPSSNRFTHQYFYNVFFNALAPELFF